MLWLSSALQPKPKATASLSFSIRLFSMVKKIWFVGESK